MEKKSLEFLIELLKTPSPSGMEAEISKKWLNYCKDYADKLDTDIFGNSYAILNPEKEYKVIIAGHCDEIGLVIKRIDSDGFLYFTKLGGISHKIAPGMKVNVLGNDGKDCFTGVIGASAEHHGGLDDGFKMDDLYIDLGAKSDKELEGKIRIGDLAVYKRDPEILMNGRISGRGLDNRTGAFIAAEVIRNLKGKKLNVGVYAVATTGEEVGLQGAFAAGSKVKANMAIATDVTFATDYPNVSTAKHGSYKLDNGPVLALGPSVNRKINSLFEKAAKDLDMKLQYELVPQTTGTDADRLRYTSNGTAVALVSLPLRYMHSPVETVSQKDIKDEIELICKFIENLEGNEDLRPVII
ncbi:MAG: M20/M25/M40 family metallo-hydrolase [Candidatus Delongbacteria bacterium]|nr:M20/M25/M40 family metallo-hydrolase [Candidatus Delongbacteria bacterium]MBN2835633.1 M20/M25/M40 family metallo-hydrolase [Candidatus Delongbacteria bacterium]